MGTSRFYTHTETTKSVWAGMYIPGCKPNGPNELGGCEVRLECFAGGGGSDIEFSNVINFRIDPFFVIEITLDVSY